MKLINAAPLDNVDNCAMIVVLRRNGEARGSTKSQARKHQRNTNDQFSKRR